MKKRFIPLLALPLMLGACNKINLNNTSFTNAQLTNANSSNLFAFEAATSIGMLNSLDAGGVRAALNETADDSLITMIKEYLPSIEAAISGSDLLSSVIETSSDLEEYTYKVEVMFKDISLTETKFTIYYNEEEIVKDDNEFNDDEDVELDEDIDDEEIDPGFTYPDEDNNQDHNHDHDTDHDHNHDDDWGWNHGHEHGWENEHNHDHDWNHGHGHDHNHGNEEITEDEENTDIYSEEVTDEEVTTSEEETVVETVSSEEVLAKHHHEDDDREFAIQGIIIINDETFEISGKKELDEENEYEVEFKFLVEDGSYIKVEQEIEEDECKLSYTIVKRGRKIYSYSLEFDNDEVELSVKDSSTCSKYTLSFKFIDWDGKTLIKATVKDGKNKTFILFEKVVDEETGEVDYLVID